MVHKKDMGGDWMILEFLLYIVFKFLPVFFLAYIFPRVFKYIFDKYAH